MNIKFAKIKTDEKGLTLAELLASITILSIIIISVITIFIQTMKTNRTSEQIIDATYIAQTEMEKMYLISKRGPSSLPSEYTKVEDEDDWEVYLKQYKDTQYVIKISLKENEDYAEMMHILIRVYDESDEEHVKAQMENLYKWGAN